MLLLNYYYYFQSAVPKKICNEIIQYGLYHKDNIAITGEFGENRNLKEQPLNKKELKNLKTKRNSNVVWLNDKWIYKEIHPFIRIANQDAGWNFEWDWSESCQFTKYKKNQHYGWHCDSWETPYKEAGTYNDKIRKLSSILILSDPKNYSGGDLEFDFRNADPDKKRNVRLCKEIKHQGSLIVFPSFVWHRVKPVKKGTRYSLVNWHLGKPFK
jgi:PKHD-type hydroxylase